MAKTLQAHPFDTSNPNYYAIRSQLTVLINFTSFAQLNYAFTKNKRQTFGDVLRSAGKNSRFVKS